jgi:glucuronoarabinoxylan endo-1,4-beta-xylanase
VSNVGSRRDRRAELLVARRKPLPNGFRHLGWPGSRKFSAVAAVLAVVTFTMSATLARSAMPGTTQVSVDGLARHQKIDGFGFAEAFQRSNILHGSLGLSPANQRRVLDLLFSTHGGAGFSMLRLGIGSSPDDPYDLMQSIEPVSPGSPAAAPAWVWDGSDNSQVWLSEQAMRYGVRRIYADAWSAPGYMKTNGTDFGGGYLCGVPGATCPSGDWRQAYANELAKFIQLYAQSGVHITDVGFLNEPELSTAYASMLSSPQQAAGFVPVLARTLRSEHLDTKVVCCDGEGWVTGAQYIQAIMSDPAAAAGLAVASAHGYTAPPASPLTTARRPVWETEWADFNAWDPAWDDGTAASGFTWAQHIMTALTAANASAFFYWWGASASTANSGLIRLQGDSYQASARLWAFAAFSRFIRPGAVRLGASSGSDVQSAAFRNRDGSVVVELLNTTSAATQAEVALRHLSPRGAARSYLTDAADMVTPQPPVPVHDGTLVLSVPPRSVVTIVLPR